MNQNVSGMGEARPTMVESVLYDVMFTCPKTGLVVRATVDPMTRTQFENWHARWNTDEPRTRRFDCMACAEMHRLTAADVFLQANRRASVGTHS